MGSVDGLSSHEFIPLQIPDAQGAHNNKKHLSKLDKIEEKKGEKKKEKEKK